MPFDLANARPVYDTGLGEGIPPFGTPARPGMGVSARTQAARDQSSGALQVAEASNTGYLTGAPRNPASLSAQDQLAAAGDAAKAAGRNPRTDPEVLRLTKLAEAADRQQRPKFDLANAKPVYADTPKPFTPPPPMSDPTSFGNLIGAALEPIATLGTGAIGSIAGGLSGLADLATGGEKYGDTARAVQHALTYQPRSTGGQNAMSVIGYPFEKIAEAADVAGGKVTDVTGSPMAGAAVNTTMQFVPQLLGSKGARLATEKGPGFLPEMAPKLAPEAELLASKGVQPTWGQMLGGGWSKVEQALSKWPIVGGPIRGARERGISELNNAAVNDALGEIGAKLPDNVKPGHAAVGWGYQKFREAYDDVQSKGMGRLGPQEPGMPAPLGSQPAPLGSSLKGDLENLMNAVRGSKLPPERVAELQRDIQREVLDKFPAAPAEPAPRRTAAFLAGDIAPTGTVEQMRATAAHREAVIDADIARMQRENIPAGNAQMVGGETIKRMQENLRNLSEAKKRSSNGDERQQGLALDEVQASIDRMMARENPKLAPELDAVDRGYAKFKIVQRAAGYVGAQGGMFTPSQLLRAIRDKDPRKDKANYAQGEARMQDFGTAAKKVLGDTLPDSGTPTQALVAALMESLTGRKGMGIFGIPGGVAGAAALAPMYSRPMLSLGERLLMNPPAAAPAAAQWLPYGVPTDQQR